MPGPSSSPAPGSDLSVPPAGGRPTAFASGGPAQAYIEAHWPLLDRDGWGEHDTPLAERPATADRTQPGMDRALAALDEAPTLRREHGTEDFCAGYVLRPYPTRRPPTELHPAPHPRTEPP
ncbi:hypothetical protein ACO0M4_33825 [Streptomyces sp. RGM 3693]|uniref:hypothetical protein n=1 Tax=Streptomyces sp. RGM 3693 TaxID=3413284 RepID=UPI003D2958D8